jgi:hypothetical protein
MKREFINCSCSSLDHLIVLDYDEDYEEVYISVHLNQYRNFFQRFWTGIRYIFGYKCRYGNWDTVIIDSSNKSKIISILENIKDENSETDTFRKGKN